jgi:hypothetical protein
MSADSTGPSTRGRRIDILDRLSVAAANWVLQIDVSGSVAASTLENAN